jgi:hypothetical protein
MQLSNAGADGTGDTNQQEIQIGMPTESIRPPFV